MSKDVSRSVWIRWFLIVMVILPLSLLAFNEAGIPLIRNYKSNDYNAHDQNWAVAQDSNGVMYFGNTRGILIYDGSFWKMITLSNNSIVRSLVIDQRGTIFAGGVGDVGYLSTDSLGGLEFVSLISHLPMEYREFSDVWRTFVTTDGICFFSRDQIMIWDYERFEIIPLFSEDEPGVCSFVRGEVYHCDEFRGISKVDNNVLEKIYKPQPFKSRHIYQMLDYSENEILLGTRATGLYILVFKDKSIQLKPFKSPVNQYLRQHLFYCGIELQNGDFALGTMNGGIYIIDRMGELKWRLTKEQGLQDNSIWGLYQDREGGLWAACNQGLARIDLAAPLMAFNDNNGLFGTVEAITRFNNRIYAATSTGFYMKSGAEFIKIKNIIGLGWSFANVQYNGAEHLLAGSYTGIYEINGINARQINSKPNVFQLFQSRIYKDIVYYGSGDGLGILRRQNNRWHDLGFINGFNAQVRSIEENMEGVLWIGSHFTGVYKITFNNPGQLIDIDIVNYRLESGLPVLRSIKVFTLQDTIRFGSSRGIYSYHEQTNRFVRDTRLRSASIDSILGIARVHIDVQGNIWISATNYNRIGHVSQNSDLSYIYNQDVFPLLSQVSIQAIFSEGESVMWIGTSAGLFRAELDKLFIQQSGYHTLISSVTSRRPLLKGHLQEYVLSDPLEPTATDFTFLFSAPSYHDENMTMFRYKLEGYENSWSDWIYENKKEYTNLGDGSYSFLVESKNIYGVSGKTASFHFEIDYPFYQTWYAYLFYFICFASFLFLVVEWRSRRLIANQRQLEKTVQIRTKELREHAINLESTRQELAVINKELSAFAYSVSHDLRTPLRAIEGLGGILLEDYSEKIDAEGRDLIERIRINIRKMSQLIESMLSLSRLTRAKMSKERVNLSQLAMGIMANLKITEPGRKVEVKITPDLYAQADPALIKVVLDNLLGNAWKYTGKKDSPNIEFSASKDEQGRMVFFVSDNGTGFNMKYANKLFTPFQRLHSDKEFSGSGIGLATVIRLINRHGGKIWAEAEEDKGATFYFYLAQDEG